MTSMKMRRARPLVQAWRGVMVAALLVWAQPAAPAAAADGNVCVYLSGGNGKVAGLQMDLLWDPTCMTVQPAMGTAAQCTAESSTGKHVQTNIFNDGSMRALFLSVSDQSPIPDGLLFCCTFTMTASPPDPCCSIYHDPNSVILSGPGGNRIYDAITLETQVNRISCASALPSGSPDNPVRPAVPVAIPAAPAPVVSAPGAPAGIPAAPAQPAALPPVAGARAAGTGQAPLPAAGTGEAGTLQAPPSEEVTPAESATQPAATAASPRTPTAQRTPAPATATAPVGTPQPQSTATAATMGSTTPGSTTQTPAPTAKKHGKKHAPASVTPAAPADR